MAGDRQEELEKRRVWFLECQLRGLNLDTFRNLATESDAFDKPALLELISEPFADPPPLKVSGPAMPFSQVYLDSRQPVWTADEHDRREALAASFIGRRCDWLEFKEPHRLIGRLRALADAYAKSSFASELDSPITATDAPPPSTPAELRPTAAAEFRLPRRARAFVDGKGRGLSRATLAETKPWLLGELYRSTGDPAPGEDPTLDWLRNLEAVLSGIETELHVSTGGDPLRRPQFDRANPAAYTAWVTETMQRDIQREASVKTTAAAGTLRTTSDTVQVSFLDKVYDVKRPTGGPPHPRPKAPGWSGGGGTAPAQDLPHHYVYDIKVGTEGVSQRPAAAYPLSYKVPYWNGVVRDAVKEVYVNKSESDMGLCLLVRMLYLFGTIPEHLADAKTLGQWRTRVNPSDSVEFDAYFDKRALDLDHDEDRMRLSDVRQRLRALLQVSAQLPHSASLVFSPVIGEALRQALHHYKFWIDEPLHAAANPEQTLARTNVMGWDEKKAASDGSAEMEYWSENHYLMFASCEYLAGQLFEFDEFQPGKQFLAKGSTDGAMAGTRRKDRGKARVLKWLNHRLMFGWTEFNSSGYYREHLWALLNLADFALDADVRDKARMATDLLLFDVARYSHRGAMGAAGGRSQFKSKASGWDNSVGDAAEILFGTREMFGDGDSEIGASMATSKYQIPDVLLEIAEDPPDTGFLDRSRTSINFDEAYRYGIDISQQSDENDSRRAGYAAKLERFSPFIKDVNDAIAKSHNDYGRIEDSIVFWWTTSSYINKQVVTGSLDLVERWGLEQTGIWSKLASLIENVIPALQDVGIGAAIGGLLGGGGGALIGGFVGLVGYLMRDDVEDIADEFSVLLEGSSRTRANIISYRSRDAMLSSIQNFRVGQLNYQSSVNQATLNRAVNVFTTAAYAGVDLSALLPAGAGALLGGAVLGPIGAVAGAAIALAVEDSELEGENIFGDETDGPSWWTGYLSLPMVVQHRGAAIIAYEFHDIQETLAETQSHTWFPKAGFDDLPTARSAAYDDDNFFLSDVFDDPLDFDSNGHWQFGRIVHRDPNLPAADWAEAYVGVFSNMPPEWLSLDNDADFYQDKLDEVRDPGDAKPEEKAKKERIWAEPLARDYFADHDWSVNGKNLWILQVGSKAEFGDFQRFVDRVRTAKVTVDDAGDFECTYHMPLPDTAGGGSQALTLDYEDGGVFKLDGAPYQTDLYPRFENPFVRGGRVEWGQRSYVIEHRGKRLLHDFHDFANPIRSQEPPGDDLDTVLALVIFVRTTGEELEEDTLGSATVKFGCATVADDQVFAVGPVGEDTEHDAEWIFLDQPSMLSPDLTLELAHSAFGDGDDEAEWSLSFRVRALMADHRVVDCTLSTTTMSFTEDTRRSAPIPFAAKTDRWRRWVTVPGGRVVGDVVMVKRPTWREFYYDHCDLLHAPALEPVRHRRFDACLHDSTPWRQIPSGPTGPDRSPGRAVHGYSRFPGHLAAVALGEGRLFGAVADAGREWSSWAGATDQTDDPIPVSVPFASPGSVSVGASKVSPSGSELVVTGADGQLYVNFDWRPEGVQRWRRLKVDGFVLRTDGDCVLAGNRVFVLAVDGSLWSAALDLFALLGFDPVWTRVGLVDHPMRRFSVVEDSAKIRLLTVSTVGEMWDVILESDGRPAQWTLLGRPGGQPVADGTRIAHAVPEAGRLDAFAVADGTVYTWTWNEAGWRGASPVGEQSFRAADQTPLVSSRVSGQVEVIVQTEHGDLMRTWWS